MDRTTLRIKPPAEAIRSPRFGRSRLKAGPARPSLGGLDCLVANKLGELTLHKEGKNEGDE